MMPYHEDWKRVALITTLVAGVLCLNYFTFYRYCNVADFLGVINE